MVNHSDKRDDNVHCVMDAIASQKNRITEDELLEQFIASTDAPRELIEYELKRILHNGVVCGFIVKTGDSYAIPTLKSTYEADCDEGEGDESEDDEKKSGVRPTASSSGRHDVSMKVEPGPSTSGTRKRAATGPSCHDYASKKIKKEPCPEAAKLIATLGEIDWTNFTVTRRGEIFFAKFKPDLITIAEDGDDEMMKREREEEEDDDESEDDDVGGGRFKDERRDDDDDDDEGPSTSKTTTLPRKSTRKVIPARGKCGGRSDHRKCAF